MAILSKLKIKSKLGPGQSLAKMALHLCLQLMVKLRARFMCSHLKTARVQMQSAPIALRPIFPKKAYRLCAETAPASVSAVNLKATSKRVCLK